MGSFDARLHATKGGSVAGAAKASEAARSNNTMKIFGFRTCMLSCSSLRGLVASLRVELHRAYDALAFFHHDHLVRLDLFHRFDNAAVPAYLQQFNLLHFADAEVDAGIVLGQRAASSAYFTVLLFRSLPSCDFTP